MIACSIEAAEHFSVKSHYIPVDTQPNYQKLCFGLGDLPNSEEFYRKAICLPLISSLTKVEQAYVIENVKKLCNG